jgi:hypothetical protein
MAMAASPYRRLAAVALFLLPLTSCAPGRSPQPPPAPNVDDAAQLVPADLDLVLRLDLARVRDALGAGVLDELRRRALRADASGSGPLVAAFAHGDTLWLGARPGEALESSDFVWVLRGNFAAFDPHRSGQFGPAEDLGGALRRFDRVGKSERADPARFYLHAADLVVAASPAELDSIERTLEQGRRDAALEPPSKGLLSLAVRPRALLQRLPAGAGQLRKLAEHVLRIEGSADVTSAGVALELAFEFGDAQGAEQVARALG